MDDLQDLQAMAEKLNKGEITLEEFARYSYQRQKKAHLPSLIACYRAKDWDGFIGIATTIYEVMPEAFHFYDEMPDNLKYDFVIRCYEHHGDSLEIVREAVKGLRRYGKPILPEELADKDIITVYRAGEEPKEEASERISWTTDKEIAMFFLEKYIGRHATHLYKGKIRTGDIIAYNDNRHEREIMQYKAVYDIEEL